MKKASYLGLNATLVRNLQRKIEELRASESKFRLVFEAARDGILAADKTAKKFLFANPAICALTGYSEKELLKLSVPDIHPKKDLPYVLSQFVKQVQGKISLAKDIPVLRKDKTVVYCDVNSSVSKIGGKDVLIGFFREATKRRNAKKELKKRI
jgi:PAS domain S-box-containing protein